MIGIISDTHDNLPAIKRAVDLFNEKNVDLVLHAGDFVLKS
jgi:putative phosphoesterase